MVLKEEDKENFEYFYRAMSLEEFGNNGGLLRQRQRADGNWYAEGPYVTQNLEYLLGEHSWIFNENQNYDIIVRYKFNKGKEEYLRSVSLPYIVGQEAARSANRPVIKTEKILRTIPNDNFGFPGATADTHYNPDIVELMVIPLNIPNLREEFRQ